MRIRAWLLLLLLSSAHAHRGLDTLAWQEGWGSYTLSALEDFHTDPDSEAQLFVQLSDGSDAAPQGTTVNAVIRLENNVIYKGALAFIANGSSDGKTFYANYLLSLPLEQDGVYEVELSVAGPLGTEQASYLVRSRRETVSVFEYLPSLIILLISVGGVALLFIPVTRKEAYEPEDNRARLVPVRNHRA